MSDAKLADRICGRCREYLQKEVAELEKRPGWMPVTQVELDSDKKYLGLTRGEDITKPFVMYGIGISTHATWVLCDSDKKPFEINA